MQWIKTITLLMILGSTAAGCTRTVIVDPAPLPVPGRPILPPITDEENQAMKAWNPDIYQKIITREIRLKASIQALEAVILSTH